MKNYAVSRVRRMANTISALLASVVYSLCFLLFLGSQGEFASWQGRRVRNMRLPWLRELRWKQGGGDECGC